MKNREGRLEDENVRLRALLEQAGLDAAASEVANNLQALLLAEMHHRIKNMMAIVQAIVVQTLRTDKTKPQAIDAITSRITALANTHDIILSTAGKGAQLRFLIEQLTSPFIVSRFEISVPDVEITSKTAVAVALVLNELGTNALKYGALSVAGGVVQISGRQDETDHVLLTWTEVGGPPVQQPKSESFGTRLIRTALPDVPKLEYRHDGVFCELQVPLPIGDL